MVWCNKILRLFFIGISALGLIKDISAETYEDVRKVERAKAELAYLSTVTELYLNSRKGAGGSVENIIPEMYKAGGINSEELLVKEGGVVDPWGNYYITKVIDRQLYVISTGPSDKGSDDIKWKVNVKLQGL